MNRNTAIALAFIVAGALILGAIYIPPLLDEVFGEKPPMSASVEFHDKDGNLVGSSVSMAIYAGGAEVETMTVKASWTVDISEGVDPATFNAHVDVHIAVWNEYIGDYEELDTRSIDSSYTLSADDPDGEYLWSDQQYYVPVYTWTLATLLQEYMTDAHKLEGWSIRIRSTLTPTAKDFGGVDVIPDPPTQDALTIFVDLIWIDTTATMDIIRFGTERWINPP